MRFLAAQLPLLFLAACSSGPSMTDAGASSAAAVVEVGNASPGTPHANAPNGAPVKVVAGPQGGFHVWLSVQVAGLPAGAEASQLAARWTLTAGADAVSNAKSHLDLQDAGGGRLEATGMVMFFQDSITPYSWMGQGLHLDVRVEDKAGKTVGTASRDWVASCCDSSNSFGGTRGGDGGAVSGALDAGEVDGTGDDSCASYCLLMATRCPHIQFEDDTCLNTCARFPAGMVGDVTGDSLQCRLHWARLSVPNPRPACLAAGPTPAGECAAH